MDPPTHNCGGGGITESIPLGREGADTLTAKVPEYLSLPPLSTPPLPVPTTQPMVESAMLPSFRFALAGIWESLCRGVPADSADTAYLLPRPAYPSKCLEPPPTTPVADALTISQSSEQTRNRILPSSDAHQAWNL